MWCSQHWDVEDVLGHEACMENGFHHLQVENDSKTLANRIHSFELKFAEFFYNIIRIFVKKKKEFSNKTWINYEFLYFFAVKNSYLIYVLLKKSRFFLSDFYNILHIYAQFF